MVILSSCPREMYQWIWTTVVVTGVVKRENFVYILKIEIEDFLKAKDEVKEKKDFGLNKTILMRLMPL